MDRKRIAGITIGVVAVAAVVGGTWAFASNAGGSASPVPSPSPSVSVTETVERVAETVAPTPTVVPAAPAPAAPVEQVEEPAPVYEPEVVVEEPAPAPEPIRCPAGSLPQANDGVNDTSCLPAHCANVVVGDPADPHPECEEAFRP